MSLALFAFGCRDNVRIKTYGKSPMKETVKVIPEVSSSIEIITDEAGQVRPEKIAGAAKFGVRILDATCTEEIANLGIQDTPEFSLPPNAYYKPLCMETTYYNSESKVLEVRMQPFTFQGPDAVEVILAKDSQLLDFTDTKDASSYSYILMDLKGQVVAADSVTESYIDFKNALATGSYKMILLAIDGQGKTMKVINYKIKIQVNPTDDPLSLNLKFERERYQTRSIKRVLLEEGLVTESTELKLNGTELDTAVVNPYKGGYAALLNAADAMMRGVLAYGSTKAQVQIIGVSTKTYDLTVEVKDFNYFQSFPAAFADQSYAKNGLEAWCSQVEQPLVRSGEHTLTADFGVMILQ